MYGNFPLFANTLSDPLVVVASVQKIVYSTCSVHEAENEEVVAQALCSPEASSGKFVLCPRKYVLPSWPRRGFPTKLGETGVYDVLFPERRSELIRIQTQMPSFDVRLMKTVRMASLCRVL